MASSWPWSAGNTFQGCTSSKLFWSDRFWSFWQNFKITVCTLRISSAACSRVISWVMRTQICPQGCCVLRSWVYLDGACTLITFSLCGWRLRRSGMWSPIALALCSSVRACWCLFHRDLASLWRAIRSRLLMGFWFGEFRGMWTCRSRCCLQL